MKYNFILFQGILILSVVISIANCHNNQDFYDERLQDQTQNINQIKYTVFFDSDDNNDPHRIRKIEVEAHGIISELPSAFRTGYDFGGWFTEKDGQGIELTVNHQIINSMTVYAKWNRINQKEFNAYEYSQSIRSLLVRDGYIFSYVASPFNLSELVAFSKDELIHLREYLEKEIQRGGLNESNFPIEYLENTFRHNINLIRTVENNFPVNNSVNNNLSGLWGLAYRIPNEGYIRGDYLKIYNNGIFEYIYRNFQASRFGNIITGGSRFGLWTTDANNIQETEIEVVLVFESVEPVEDIYFYLGYENQDILIIWVFNNNWRRISEDINFGLDWGVEGFN